MNIILLSCFLAIIAPSHIISDVPFVMQESHYCGPASLSSVLSYYGDMLDQKTIGKSVYNPHLDGSLITDLEDFAVRRGFQTRIGRGNANDIKESLLKDRPVIVLVDTGYWVLSKPHYLVIYGFNEQGFLAHDGYKTAQLFLYEEFGEIWERAGSTFLLIHR